MTWLLYGAYGYTGELIARAAVERGLDPILAGRSREKVDVLAADLDCESRVFSLSDPALAERLDDVDLVLNCAGPFVDTHEPLVAACLESGSHYLDVTGEIEVFESIREDNDRARRADLTLLPGVGFDVVPSDCLAAHLVERLPEAESLTIGYQPAGGFSPGTLKTAITGLGEDGLVRRDGRLEPVSIAWETREIDFGDGPVPAMTAPLGDVSTAYHTTGVPNIECYLAVPPVAARWLRYQRYLDPVLALDPVQTLLAGLVDRLVEGPDAETRAETTATLWGEVRSRDATRVSRLRTPNVYRTTKLAALETVERVLAGDAPAGYQTPASAFGSDLILSVEGVERIDEWHR
ncbi:saccharopine dehydrogenase family protein [Halapricum hydrolyticum]|uniref:Saccharopine dehydrogenase NADP-binding domain-containing protein n=1 Tax=Halapricum hydrolyticum TaxID=2979991 RepID=A0AAE3ICW8_9EURY|nr:saccharopine dehydrogenase NADP-binding domain-containing protein [Halapricum hydrolyticum]MCU4719169.1 saccharopine dehydrogenase NADP-binding domain-containing protein [Halapricum hydrolyticum]MCU4728260.1 saccharopine dehydrogenase NADP-binding domain-containing protein [Halapricum hydrolyticum]